MPYPYNYKRLPVVLTFDELERLLEQPNPKAPTGLRNLCILRIMANAGLRCSEALAVTVRNINWMSGQLDVVNAKGGYDRTLWLNEDDLDILREWRSIRPAGKCEELFTTLKGTPVSDRYVRQMVKRLAKRAGIEKDVHPHALRHTFATDLYRQTKNIRLVQKALGHTSLSSTMIYTHIVDDELEHALKTFRNDEEEGNVA